MLSTQLKAEIQKLWDAFWAGGIANPLTAIEQITYLVFLKRLEDLDLEGARNAQRAGRTHRSIYAMNEAEGKAEEKNSPDAADKATEEAAEKSTEDAAGKTETAKRDKPIDKATFRWSYIKQLPPQERWEHVRGPVFAWLQQIEEGEEKERMRDAVFLIPNANLLTRAVDIIDKLFVPERNQDTLGDIYEHLLKEIAVAGKNGQFRTPRHIIRAMCDLIDPQYGESICDPACGTGGFLVNAYQHILKRHTSLDILRFAADGTPLDAVGDQLSADQHQELRRNHLHGFDFDRTMVRLGWMNLIQHGLENPDVRYGDTLGSIFNRQVDPYQGELYEAFDVVLANPPFTGNIDKSDIGPTLKWLNTTKTELLFVELILQLLKPGGRAAVIVPEGVLFGSTGAHLALRKKLVSENQLKAVISLPGGVFQPYTGVKTSILLLQKGGQTDTVWFYEVSADGESLNAKRTPQPEQNDLWDLVIHYRLRHAMPPPAFVPAAMWAEWQALAAEARPQSYARPELREKLEQSEEGEAMPVLELASLVRQEATDPKAWTASVSKIQENDDYNLSAGRYKPMAIASAEYGQPEVIIEELWKLEQQIQDGLASLQLLIKAE